jgi:hypothetical protein
LDTRTKIVEPRSVPSGGPVRVIVGYFDPIHAAEIRELRRLAPANTTIVAAIDDPPDPLLPVAGRAELAAALGFVDFVVTDVSGAMAIAGAEIADIRPGDLKRREELARHVVRRHGSE